MVPAGFSSKIMMTSFPKNRVGDPNKLTRTSPSHKTERGHEGLEEVLSESTN